LNDFDLNRNLNVSFFETTIRVIGGLLGAYDLTKDSALLFKAAEVADRLIPAFHPSESKGISILPYPSINLASGRGYATWGGHVTTLAELGSFQLEFNYLSEHTKNRTYAEYAERMLLHMDNLDPKNGLFPLLYSLKDGKIAQQPNNIITLGASADSFYEYVLKQWIQTGKKDEKLRQMYDEMIEGMATLLYATSQTNSWFLAEFSMGAPIFEMDHLACFVPGMLALGAYGKNKERDMHIASQLMTSCVDMYKCSPSGLAPDRVNFHQDYSDFIAVNPKYLLRPETLESLFIMYRKTKDSKYRNIAWNIYESIERNCRTKYGYSGIDDVRRATNAPKDDIQHAYLLSETFKYLYLIFDDSKSVDIEAVVFNTEAHALSILHEQYNSDEL